MEIKDLTIPQMDSELKNYFSAEELDEAKEEINDFIAEVNTTEELVSKISLYLLTVK